MNYVRVKSPVAIVAVDGIFDIPIASIVKNELISALDDKGCTKIEIDFQNTVFIDSSVFRVCMKIRRRVGKENFAVKNAHGVVLAALKTSNLDEWIK